jgi:putative ABC transport system permease protein
LPVGLSQAAGAELYAHLLPRLESTPGVISANIAVQTPLTLSSSGRTYEKEDGDVTPVNQNLVSRGHFKTLGIPLLAGRDFTDADRTGAPLVCIVNERLARRLWPGQNPIGKRLREETSEDAGPWIEVIGLVRDSKYTAITEDPKQFLYRPLLQHNAPQVSLLLKTQADPLSLLPQVHAAVGEIDPDIPVFAVSSLENATAISLLPEKIAAHWQPFWEWSRFSWVRSASMELCHTLPEIGLVKSGSGSHRETRRSQVIRSVTAEVVRWTAAGLVLGLAAGLAVTTLLRDFLYGVPPADPVSFGGVALLLFVTAYAACWLPARRASRIDPLIALREE